MHRSAYLETADAKTAELLRSQAVVIATLIKGCSSIEVVSASEVPQGCALESLPAARTNVHVLVKGKVDIDAELSKLMAKVDLNGAALAKIETQRASADWEKTPAEVQQTALEREQNLTAEKQALLAAKATFESLRG